MNNMHRAAEGEADLEPNAGGSDARPGSRPELRYELVQKLDALTALLEELGSLAVCFSGGVDSTFLAAVCARRLSGAATLVHLNTPLSATPERDAMAASLRRLDMPFVAIDVDPLSSPNIASNPPERCYHCKRLGLQRVVSHAREHGISCVVEGSNADDLLDFRPGMRAVRELGIASPLARTGWRKNEEREVLRAWGFEVWNLPAGACLATRVACGEPLTTGKLVLARAVEDAFRDAGARQVRCRMAKGVAHVEMAEADMQTLAFGGAASADAASAAARARDLPLPRDLLPRDLDELLLAAGLVGLDPVMRPYRKGSMN